MLDEDSLDENISSGQTSSAGKSVLQSSHDSVLDKEMAECSPEGRA